MDRAELLKFKKEIEADYHADMAAITRLLERWEESRIVRSKALSAAISSVSKRPSQCAEEIIKKMQGDFEVYTIVQKMREELGRHGLHFGDIARQAIHLLRQRGEIETVTPGKGSRSGVYRYKRS